MRVSLSVLGREVIAVDLGRPSTDPPPPRGPYRGDVLTERMDAGYVAQPLLGFAPPAAAPLEYDDRG